MPQEYRILLLADAASPHIQKWAVGLAQKGYVIGLFSLNTLSEKWFEQYENIQVLYRPAHQTNPRSIREKGKYIFALPALLKAIKTFNPHILHAHYATSYGLLGALTGFSPYLLSVWGTDVFEFPKKSFLHKQLFKFNLHRARHIFSTSHAMRTEILNYTHKTIEVIPFGVDINQFYPLPREINTPKKTIHIGAIKSMEDQYGIQTIIEAFSIIKKKTTSVDFILHLVGGGSRLKYYKDMVLKLKISESVIFTGIIPWALISDYHNRLDLFLNVSNVNESFGVSVLEAMACGKPVIVTDAPGLKEIVNPKVGRIIPKDNTEELVSAILTLSDSPLLLKEMGIEARKHVLQNYSFNPCLESMSSKYIASIA